MRQLDNATVWESYAHASAIKADPSYARLLEKRAMLATGGVLDFHVRFSGNPLRILQAPVTEVDIYKTLDEGVEQLQERVQGLAYRIESLQMRGFIALSWGIALEDRTRGAYIGGWRTVEVHFASSCSYHRRRTVLMALVSTGSHAYRHTGFAQGVRAGLRRDISELHRAFYVTHRFQAP